MKEREGNYTEAINLYLKAGLPAKAARLAMNREVRPTHLMFITVIRGIGGWYRNNTIKFRQKPQCCAEN